MLQYGLAEDTVRSGKPDVSPNELYSQSAIYVAAAHALKPNYSVSICASVIFPTICHRPFSLFFLQTFLADCDLLTNAGLSECFAISPLNGIINLFCF
jgi:hypothetical protein